MGYIQSNPYMEKRKFQRLVTKYLSGKASAEEEELIVNYLDAFQKNDEGWNSSEMGEEDLIRNELYQKTLEEIKAREGSGKVFRLRWLSAAAIVLVFLSGLYYTLRNDKPVLAARTERFKNDVLPGAAKATLVLADGSRITLDDKENGNLTSQAGVIIKKTKEGQLIYDLSKTRQSLANNSEVAYNMISTPNGGKYMLILEDGTKIWLNSASSLRFPVAFKDNTRNVELTGEAYFEVAHNDNKPFKVITETQTVEVLGTHFNLSAYSDDDFSKTTLYEGRVTVKGQGAETILTPGQQAVLQGNKLSVKNITNDDDLAWKNNEFAFHNESLESILKKLVRWYDVEFICPQELKQLEFGGYIHRQKSLKQALDLIGQEGTVHFEIERRKIIVMK